MTDVGSNAPRFHYGVQQDLTLRNSVSHIVAYTHSLGHSLGRSLGHSLDLFSGPLFGPFSGPFLEPFSGPFSGPFSWPFSGPIILVLCTAGRSVAGSSNFCSESRSITGSYRGNRDPQANPRAPGARHVSSSGSQVSSKGRPVSSKGRPVSSTGRHVSNKGHHVSNKGSPLKEVPLREGPHVDLPWGNAHPAVPSLSLSVFSSLYFLAYQC